MQAFTQPALDAFRCYVRRNHSPDVGSTHQPRDRFLTDTDLSADYEAERVGRR